MARKVGVLSSALSRKEIGQSAYYTLQLAQKAARADAAAKKAQEAIAQASVAEPAKPAAQSETPNPTLTAG